MRVLGTRVGVYPERQSKGRGIFSFFHSLIFSFSHFKLACVTGIMLVYDLITATRFIGYKTSTNAADAITGLLVVTNNTESTSTTYGDGGFKFGGAKTMMVDGKRYYLAEYGGNADMNNGNSTHKNPVYLYYTKDGNTTNGAQLITTLGAHRCDKNSEVFCNCLKRW